MDDSTDQRPLIGEALVARGDVGRLDVHAAVRQQDRGDARRLGEILVARGAVEADVLAEALAELGLDPELPPFHPAVREVREVAAALEARAGDDPALGVLATRLRRVQAALVDGD